MCRVVVVVVVVAVAVAAVAVAVAVAVAGVVVVVAVVGFLMPPRSVLVLAFGLQPSSQMTSSDSPCDVTTGLRAQEPDLDKCAGSSRLVTFDRRLF